MQHEHEMELLKKSQRIAVFCSHDDYHGRFADEDTGANPDIREIRYDDCVQCGIASRSVRMDRKNRESVQIFRFGQEGQGRAQSLHRPHDRFISGPVDASLGQATHGGLDHIISSTTIPLQDEIYRLRQGTAGRNRQRARTLVGSCDEADFRPRVSRLRRQAIRAFEEHLAGAHLQFEIKPNVSNAGANLRQDPKRYGIHWNQTQARPERAPWVYSSGYRALGR